MNVWIQALTVLLPTAYFCTAVLYGMAFAGDKAPPPFRLRGLALAGTLCLHAALFGLHASATREFPVVGTWLMVSAIALSVAGLFALITWKQPQPAVGGIVFAVVTFLQLLASAFGPVTAPEGVAPTTAFTVLHVSTSVLASAVLVLSGLYGLLHILLYRQMRARRFGPIFRELPDLELLARMTRRAALAGFIFLTAGVNIGIGVAHARDTLDFRYTDPQVVLSLAIWLHFGLIAFSRVIRGLTARRASFAACAGLVTLLVTLLLALVPGLTFHRFH